MEGMVDVKDIKFNVLTQLSAGRVTTTAILSGGRMGPLLEVGTAHFKSIVILWGDKMVPISAGFSQKQR